MKTPSTPPALYISNPSNFKFHLQQSGCSFFFNIHPILSYSFAIVFGNIHVSLVNLRDLMDKMAQYARVFNHFDENKDGRISPTELRQCVEAVGGNLSAEEAEAAVELLDSDGDGLVGLDDFVRFVEGGKEEEKMDDLREAFKMYEMEGRGCITPKSLKRMLGRLGESKSIDECQAMISRFDLDGDGVLSFDEFRVMML